VSHAQLPHLSLFALPSIPEIHPGDDLGAIIAEQLRREGIELQDGDVIVVTQKIVSKAEGRLVELGAISPSPQAIALADRTGKDSRLVEVILRESRGVVRERPGLIITETHHGWICANAGVDRSNIADPDAEVVLTLPLDPDASARRIRDRLCKIIAAGGAPAPDIAVIITDSHGRAWRRAAVNLAIGVAGMQPIVDLRGQADRFGRTLQVTTVARADELAAAAGLLSGQAAEGLPVVIIRGADWPHGEGRATDIQRPIEKDMFR
jgi:coenzyme F420-0:L-glutamate ligase / coenzyme F420-1:gamma-L-glutamate ligase